MQTLESPLAKTYATLPFSITSGHGMYVFGDDGKRYLDLYGGHAVASLGHSPPEIARAIATQAQRLFFYSNVAPMPLRDEAAWRLLSYAGGASKSVFFCNSGSEANESALRLAILKTGRKKIVGLSGGWHGRTLLAAAATDDPSWHEALGSWVSNATHTPANDLAGLEVIDQETAAVIAEPIQSMAGVVEISDEYLSALRNRCDEVGAALIFDEVQTGVGRCGVPFMGAGVVQPDMITSAKGLGGGMTVGALLLNSKYTDSLAIGDLGSTFGGSPIAVAAMIATLDAVDRDSLAANAARVGQYAKKVLAMPGVEEVRGQGLLLGLKLSVPSKPVVSALVERGIITGSSIDPFVLRLLPPLIAQEEHIDTLKTTLTAVLA